MECGLKVGRLGAADRCSLVRGNVFDYQFPSCTHYSALVGFLLSHLSDEQEHLLMQVLRQTLRPDARVLILGRRGLTFARSSTRRWDASSAD